MLRACGIAFHQAPPSLREAFRFDEARIASALVRLKRENRADGVAVLATCDRLEVWTSGGEGDLYEPLCRAFSLSVLAWKRYARSFDGDAALRHLFTLACGLDSPLFGEDPIISQVEQASVLSRRYGCASGELQQAFRLAVTTAKRVHAAIDLDAPEPGLPDAIRKDIPDGTARRMLVIGSSATARLVAGSFHAWGWDVAMTLRDERKTDLVPPGVRALGYDGRYGVLPSYAVVVCATKGLGYALDGDAPVAEGQRVYDLAEPRDVAEELAGRCVLRREGDLVYSRTRRERNTARTMQAVEEGMAAFAAWKGRGEARSSVSLLAEQAAQELVFRLHEPVSRLDLEEGRREAWMQTLADTAYKAVVHVLYRAQGRRYADLSHPLTSGPALYAGDPDVLIDDRLTVARDGCAVKRVEMGTHAGTHVDAPAHVREGGRTIDAYPPARFLGRALVCRIADLDHLPAGTNMVLLATGWDRYWGTDAYGRGYPVPTEEQARALVAAGVTLLGIDAPSVDAGEGLAVHRILLGGDVLIVENLCGLVPLVGKTVSLVALPLAIKNGDGAPVRACAVW